jgi:hypothetical protein
MRLTEVFFANHAEVVDDMLNVRGACWASTTVAPGADGFQCYCVVLCDAVVDDAGKQLSLRIDAAGPTRRWTAARSIDFTVPGPVKFMITPPTVLPIEPGGGLHLYTFRLDSQHGRIDVPLEVHVAQG